MLFKCSNGRLQHHRQTIGCIASLEELIENSISSLASEHHFNIAGRLARMSTLMLVLRKCEKNMI
jgi:hypothetical protein